MTTMQDNFVTRDTSNAWESGINTPNPRMAVMAMEDGFVMPTAAFNNSVPMTNYNDAELGVTSTPETFASEEEEEFNVVEQDIPGQQTDPITPSFMDILGVFKDWAVGNVGNIVIGGFAIYGIYRFVKPSKE